MKLQHLQNLWNTFISVIKELFYILKKPESAAWERDCSHQPTKSRMERRHYYEEIKGSLFWYKAGITSFSISLFCLIVITFTYFIAEEQFVEWFVLLHVLFILCSIYFSFKALKEKASAILYPLMLLIFFLSNGIIALFILTLIFYRFLI